MFVKAIAKQEIIGDYTHIEVGDEVWGKARSCKQDFINIEDMHDNKDYVEGTIDKNGYPENIDDMFKYRNIKVKVEKDSIERLICGCGQFAVHEICSEPLCKECEYEEPEDHSYLSRDSLDWAKNY